MSLPDAFSCLASVNRILDKPLGALDDPEGERVPDDLPPVVDAHVHCFPDPVFDALWRWFEANAWPIRYRLYSEGVIDFLLSRGVAHLILLHYAHKPGMARALNTHIASLLRPEVTGLATVMPGEPDSYDVLTEGFAMGLAGVKLHCHVQCFSPDDERLEPVYAACADHDLPLVIHAGREPSSAAYKCDPHDLCAVDRMERVLKRWPTLRVCVPHLGADEFVAYGELMRRYDTLWLDTTMVVGEFFPMRPPPELLTMRPDRILYGTDFPNVPYAWDRELRLLQRSGLSDVGLEKLLGGNARALFQRR